MIELIPETHLFRKINRMVLFDFICDFTASYYPTNGRPYVDLVSMFEMLLMGYLYSIKSEHRLVQEIQLNICLSLALWLRALREDGISGNRHSH